MKRCFLLSIVLALLLTLCGCNNSNTDNNTQQEIDATPDTDVPNESKSDALIVDAGITIDNLYLAVRDIFTAKVVKKIGEIDDSDFGNYGNHYATPILYHVEVLESICTQVVTEKQTIKLVNYEIYDQNVSYFAKPLEVGKTYLFGGMAQVAGNSVVFVDTGVICSEISKGKLIPINSVAQNNYLKDIKTLDEIKNCLGVSALKKQLTVQSLPTTFVNDYTVKNNGKEISLNSTTVSTADYNSYLSVLREAVKVGSKETLTKIADNQTSESK